MTTQTILEGREAMARFKIANDWNDTDISKPSTRNLRFIIYARKSTERSERQQRSIPDQIAELTELAEKEQLRVVDILQESKSAYSPGRPVFNEMLGRLERGEADGILAWHPDRLARNALDGGRVIHALDTAKIKALKFCSYNFDPSPLGKFTLAIALSQSKYYSESLSENIRRGVRQKIKNGIWSQCAPVGYINDRLAKTIVPDPAKARLVKKAFELYAEGNSIAQVREVVNGMGLVGRTDLLSISNYHRMLKNPIYYGVILHKGELHAGKHEPIITKKLFDACQEVMTGRHNPKASGFKPYIYRGVFRCGECGCFITTEKQKGHEYLRCTKRRVQCSQRYVRADIVHEQIAQAIASVAVPANVAEELIAELEAEKSTYKKANAMSIDMLREQAEVSSQKLMRLIALYVEPDSQLPAEPFRKSKAQFINEKKEIEEKIVTLQKKRGGWFEPAISFLNDLKTATFLSSTGSPTKNLDFFRKVGSNLKVTNKQVHWEARGAWELVVNAHLIARQSKTAPVAGAVSSVGEADDHLKR